MMKFGSGDAGFGAPKEIGSIVELFGQSDETGIWTDELILL